VLPELSAGTACPTASTGGVPLEDFVYEPTDSALVSGAGSTTSATFTVAEASTPPSALSTTDVIVNITASAAVGNWDATALFNAGQTEL
jgi:hypothetical protein